MAEGRTGVKGTPDIGLSILRDVVNELYSKQGWLRRNLLLLNWVINEKSLRARGLVNQYYVEKSENIKTVGIFAFPMFPARGRDDGFVDFAKVVILHVQRLREEDMDEIIKMAIGTKTEQLRESGRDARDTEIVVIADEMEKGANLIFAKRARASTAAGSRGTLVFLARKELGWIRKQLYSILAKWLSTRAVRVREKGEETLRRMSTGAGGIYGDLEACVDFVAGFARELGALAAKIKLPFRRKTKEERGRDRLKLAIEDVENQGIADMPGDLDEGAMLHLDAKPIRRDRNRGFMVMMATVTAAKAGG